MGLPEKKPAKFDPPPINLRLFVLKSLKQEINQSFGFAPARRVFRDFVMGFCISDDVIICSRSFKEFNLIGLKVRSYGSIEVIGSLVFLRGWQSLASFLHSLKHGLSLEAASPAKNLSVLFNFEIKI